MDVVRNNFSHIFVPIHAHEGCFESPVLNQVETGLLANNRGNHIPPNYVKHSKLEEGGLICVYFYWQQQHKVQLIKFV